MKLHRKISQSQIPLTSARPGDAGLDLCNASGGDVVIAVGRSVNIESGISVKIPNGYCGLIRPRSSTFGKRGLLVIASIIDEGYTGPLYSVVYKIGLEGNYSPVVVGMWERLAQMIIIPYLPIDVQIVEELPSTERGVEGFGSTGV